MEASAAIRYRAAAEELFYPELGTYISYAILCEAEQADGERDLLGKIPDVTDCQEEAEFLAALCEEERLDPCQLPEIVEDWLNR